MISVDTNLVVRLIVADDVRQLKAVERLMATEEIFVSHIALVETAWVLRSVYRYSVSKVHDALIALLDLDRIKVDAKDHVYWALDRFGKGADLSDMFLLVAARGTNGFASFDRKLAKQAGSDSPVPVIKLAP